MDSGYLRTARKQCDMQGRISQQRAQRGDRGVKHHLQIEFRTQPSHLRHFKDVRHVGLNNAGSGSTGCVVAGDKVNGY